MSAAQLVEQLRRRGILVVASGDGRLRCHPRNALCETERAAIARHRQAILTLRESDPVGWRTGVMADQAAATSACPLFLARPGLRVRPGSCFSCGARLDPAEAYRCSPCLLATIRALCGAGPAGAVS
jgi:hypothetical protein